MLQCRLTFAALIIGIAALSLQAFDRQFYHHELEGLISFSNTDGDNVLAIEPGYHYYFTNYFFGGPICNYSLVNINSEFDLGAEVGLGVPVSIVYPYLSAGLAGVFLNYDYNNASRLFGKSVSLGTKFMIADHLGMDVKAYYLNINSARYLTPINKLGFLIGFLGKI